MPTDTQGYSTDAKKQEAIVQSKEDNSVANSDLKRENARLLKEIDQRDDEI